MTTSSTARRALRTSIEIHADPSDVWAAISDLRQMPRWSPQCRIMLPLGPLRPGTRTLNINRNGRTFWPTTSTILNVDAGTRLAFRTNTNRAVWTYELQHCAAGTLVTLHRDASTHTPPISAWLVDNALGGIDEFDNNIHRGMRETLLRIKQFIEDPAATENPGNHR